MAGVWSRGKDTIVSEPRAPARVLVRHNPNLEDEIRAELLPIEPDDINNDTAGRDTPKK
jgi:hypothetical protein